MLAAVTDREPAVRVMVAVSAKAGTTRPSASRIARPSGSSLRFMEYLLLSYLHQIVSQYLQSVAAISQKLLGYGSSFLRGPCQDAG
jgi:hypothetical protein